MSMIDELIQLAQQTDLEALKRRQMALRQQFLNVRAQAAMAGLADMQYMIDENKKLNGDGKPEGGESK
jgi:hypothetical protein